MRCWQEDRRPRQRNEMQRGSQPVQMKAGGWGWTHEAAALRKVMQGGGGATRCNMTTSRQTRGNQEEKWTRGGSSLQGRGGISREQEEVAAWQQGQCNNQLTNKRQIEGSHQWTGGMMRGGGWGADRQINNQLNKKDFTRGRDQGASRQHDNQVGEEWDERTPVPMINDGKDDNEDAPWQQRQQRDCDCTCVYDGTVTAPVFATVDGRHEASGSKWCWNGNKCGSNKGELFI